MLHLIRPCGLLFTLSTLLSLVALGQNQTTIIRASYLLDVETGKVVIDPQVNILDGKIVSIGLQTEAIPKDAHLIDLKGKTLLPGLIDMHVHLTSDPVFGGYNWIEFTDNFWTVVGVSNAKKTLEAGFTTVRNLGSSNYDDVALMQGIEKGYIIGPRIIPATYAIGATGGHCDSTEFPPSIKTPSVSIADGVDAIRATVRKLRKYGAQAIKFCATGGVFSKTTTIGAQQYSFLEMKALVEESHLLGLKVAAHAHGTNGLNDAIRAGVDTIEHASLADAESFRLAKNFGTYFSMDIYNDDYILAEGEKNGVFKESLDKEREIGLKQRQTFQAAFKAGVKMVFGSDAGVYPHGDNAKQFFHMVKWGMSPKEAIQAATIHAAKALGKEDTVGSISPGKMADIIAVDGEPLRNVETLEKIDFVMKGGVIYKQ